MSVSRYQRRKESREQDRLLAMRAAMAPGSPKASKQSLALLYPERKRCLRCRKFLAFTIIEGLYCSVACAVGTDPEGLLEVAPRECKVKKRGPNGKKNNYWEWKKRYIALSDVDPQLLREAGSSVYRCGYCFRLHVGHRRWNDPDLI